MQKYWDEIFEPTVVCLLKPLIGKQIIIRVKNYFLRGDKIIKWYGIKSTLDIHFFTKLFKILNFCELLYPPGRKSRLWKRKWWGGGIIGENLVRDQKLSNPLIFSFIYEKCIPSLFIFSFMKNITNYRIDFFWMKLSLNVYHLA